MEGFVFISFSILFSLGILYLMMEAAVKNGYKAAIKDLEKEKEEKKAS